MSNTQWSNGLCNVTNGSQIVIGTASCDWANQITTTPAIFRVSLTGESTYSIGTVSSASKIILSAKYTGSTNSGLSYTIGRSFTSNRNYWRVLSGDYDFAEILSQETIDPIDTDIALLFTAYSTGSAVGTLASTFAINMDATLCRFWTDNLTSSRDFRFPNQNATLAGLGVAQEFSVDQTFNASVWIKGNASIDGTLTIGNLGIVNLSVNDLNATTGDIYTLHTNTFTASNYSAITNAIASISQNINDISVANASIDILQSDMVRANASIDILQSDIINANASISRNASDIIVANASIDALQANAFYKTIFNAKGDILTASADDTPSILSVGANDTVLTADSTKIGGLKWSVPAGGGDVAGPATNTDLYIPQWNGADSKVLKNGFAKTEIVLKAAFNAKGDILSASADNIPSILSASTDGLVLTLDSSEISGLKWTSVTTSANPVLKTANYQILTTDNMILASGNVTITLASASSKHGIRIGNRSLDANASTLVKKSGGDTIEGNASLNLANKYDTVYLIGDGTNTHFQF